MPVEQLRIEEMADANTRRECEPARERWANKAEFILSALGYCIGIGNVWRFPYLCYRSGGGAFLVPYFLMLVLCGIPLSFMEIALGQFSSQGCISVFRISPLFKGAGYAMVVVNFLCSAYYNIVLTYPLYFIYVSFQSPLPWESCDNPWNTPACFKKGPDGIPSPSNMSIKWKTPADEYFHNEVLRISEGVGTPGGIVWHLLLCNLISWLIIYLCILNGVKSVGKVVYFTVSFPYIILFIFLIRGLTLPGSNRGLVFFLYPDWVQLKNLKVWADAAVQLFFAMGPGWGGILNIASYNNFRNKMRSESVYLPITNCATSILSGLVIFSILGYLSHMTGLPVPEVATEGAGLAYVVYPEAVSLMPFPQLWSILFFLMLYFLGMDSLFVQIEAIIGSLTDEYPKLRNYKKMVTLGSVIAMALVSISMCTNGGMYVLQLLDTYSVSVPVILTCMVEIFIVAWIYGIERFCKDVEFMIEQPLEHFWKYCLKYVTTIVLVFIFTTTLIFYTRVSYNNIEYPDWAVAIGWLTAVSSMMLIFIVIIYKLATTPGTFKQRFVANASAAPEWGPADSEHRAKWKMMLAKERGEELPLGEEEQR